MKWDRQSAEARMDELEEICEGFLNLIPSNFYLDHSDEWEPQEDSNDADNSNKKKKQPKENKWDPLAPITTSQKVLENARKQGSQPGMGGNKPANARSKKVESSAQHQDLKAKLHAKIAELKEQRRQAQSEKDKQAAADYIASKLQENPNYMTKKDKENLFRKRKAGTDIPDDMDFGKMTFETKKADLPFEATRNAPGTKKKKLKAAIREAEKADAQDDDGEHALDKAMKMASGEKMKDSLQKLKKTEKRINKQKKASADAWHERKQDLEDEKAKKQEARKTNISNRMKNKKPKKNRAGFEGEKDEFLNKKKKDTKAE